MSPRPSQTSAMSTSASSPAAPSDSKFILYTTDDGRSQIALYADGGSVWLNQSQLAELFDTSKQLISHHANNILKEGELFRNSVVKEYLTTAADGNFFWRGNVDRLIQAQDLALLTGGGSVSNQTMEDSVRETYAVFDARRKAADARAADEADLKELERTIENRKK